MRAINSRINDLYICPTKYYFRFIFLVGYTLFLTWDKKRVLLSVLKNYKKYSQGSTAIHLKCYSATDWWKIRRRIKSLKKFWRHKNEGWGEKEWEKTLKNRWIIPHFYLIFYLQTYISHVNLVYVVYREALFVHIHICCVWLCIYYTNIFA